MSGATDRVKEYLNTKGISKYSFYKKTGFSNKFLDNSSNMGTDRAEIILRYYPEISPEWLLTGTGDMLKSVTDPEASIPIAHLTSNPVGGIPLIPVDAFAGFGTENSTQVMEYECERYVIPNFKGAEFLIQVKGNSMYPKYASGDIVACKKLPLETFFQWNKVYVADTEQGVLIKRVKKGESDDTIMMVSENRDYEPFQLRREEIVSLAIVIGVIRLE